jgi:hypothetical protein
MNACLLVVVECGLARRGSPQEICAKIAVDDPHDATMRIAQESCSRTRYTP